MLRAMLSSEGTNGAVTVVSTWSRTRLTGLFSTALTTRLGSEVWVGFWVGFWVDLGHLPSQALRCATPVTAR